MSVGEANGIRFTGADLDGIVAAFDALGLSGRVPLKLGHNDEQPLTDGQPALGWVSRIYREGDKLLADFVDVPTSVYELIQTGAYKFVSVELLKNVQAGTRVIPWVLDAVALLGADQPAFGNLRDLQSLTLKRKPVFQARARVAFRRDSLNISRGKQVMEEKDVQAAIEAALKKQREEMRAEFKSELDKVRADAKAEADAQVKRAKADAHRSLIKAKFEAAVQAEALLPARRESFYKFHKVDDDEAVMQIKLEDVDAYIEEFGDKAKMSAKTQTQSVKDDDKDDEKGLSADQVVVKRAEKLCYSRNKDPKKDADYQAAVIEVLRADKELARKYSNLHEAA